MKRLNKCNRRLALISVMLLLASGFAQAQTFRGTILGTVVDSSGAAIPGAQVVVRNQGTAQTRTTTSGDAGTYTVPELPIGQYAVTVSKEGFESMTVGDVEVTVAGEHRVDVTLEPGKIESRVEVEATAPLVTTTEDTLGGTVQSSTVANLPVNGRDYTKLIYLQPGVSGGPDQITDSPGSFGEFSVNGARGRSNNFLLDGTDMNDGYRNDPAINQAGVFGTPATILPVDAVAELAVLSNFAPEYGRNAGGVINIVTKSGTNQIHGTAADYFRNDALDARNFFNTAPTPKTAFHNNQFGGSLGGPIIKDRAFFFGDYEGQRETGGLNSTACVPSANNIAQAESTLASEGLSVNPVIAALLKRSPWPAANSSTPDSCATVNNVSATANIFNSVNSVIAKADYNINEKNMLTARYYYSTSNQSFPLGLGGTGDLPGYNTVTPTNVNLLSVSYLTMISLTKVNEVRFGYNRFYETFIPQDSNFNPASIGLDTGASSQDYGLPKISIAGFTSIGATSSDPRGRTDKNWQFIDNFSWKLNKHSVKIGYEFRRTTVSQFFDEGFRGSLSFLSLTDFLQGMPTGGGTILEGDTDRNTYQDSHAFYVQDSFRVSHQFTLNYGLRWDYFGVLAEDNNLLSNFNPANGVLSQVGTGGLSSLYQPDHKNFAPRLSVAYDLNGKGTTVIRFGWGLFYDVFSQDFFLGQVPYNAETPGSAYNDIGPKPILSSSTVATQIVAGQPVFTDFGTSSNLFAVAQHLPTPYMYNYNLNIQQQVGKAIVFQVGYVGSEGHHLFRFRDINQQQLSCQLGISCVANFPYPDYGYINYLETSANSVYNALQTQLRIRNFHGLESTVNYNYSHSIDNASDGTDFEPNAAQPNDSYRVDLERGNSNFDVRHRFTWMTDYKLPSPRGAGAWSKLGGGWAIDSVVTLQTGQPFQLNFNYSGDYDGSGEYFPRPDVIGNPYAGASTPDAVINLSAFKVPCTFLNGACIPGTQHPGTEGRNSLWGPGFKQWDLALYKDTSISDRVKMQFRADFFNVVNHPNFTNPFLPTFFAACDSIGINPNTGACEGFLPTTATGDVGEGNPFIGGGGPRGIQLAMKFSF
ncbi:MAG TPA: TonB-dependent receptor [Terriglobia bacterium]|nr:TonB-dependent receptor [Terriglobia bacterium]